MRNVIIIGTGIAGKLLYEDIQKNYSDINVLGFVGSEPVQSVPLLGDIDNLKKIISIYKIDEIIVAIPSADGALMRKILLNLLDNRIPIKLIPRTREVINHDNVSFKLLKDFTCEDFLGRAFKKIETSRLVSVYSGKTVLVTGGAGSIGSEIVRQLLDLQVKKIIVYDNSELGTFNLDQNLHFANIPPSRYKLIIGSVTNAEKINKIIAEEQPDFVFHAAAYKHVYLMEDNIDEAIINNVVGTKNVVDATLKNKVGNFVFISTDKVVNPTSIMGSTKKLGEFYIKQFKNIETKCNIVRFGNVINSNGSVLPLFEFQLANQERLTVTHKDVKRFFMSIKEAAQLVISSATREKDGEIYVLNMGELIKVYEIACCLIRSKNLIPNVDIPIEIIGLKKGEKLVEELFTKSEMENLEITEIDDVYHIKNYDNPLYDINEAIEKLRNLVATGTPKEEIKEFLKELFPSLKN